MRVFSIIFLIIGEWDSKLPVEIENLKRTKNEQRLLAQIIEKTPVPTFVINVEHKIIYWNTACENVTGVAASEAIGTNRPWYPFYHAERPTMADLIIDGRIEDMKSFYAGKYHRSTLVKDTWEAEDYFPHFPGGGRWLSFSATVLKDNDGIVIGAMETLRDITQQKLFEAELKEKEHLLTQIIDGCPVPMFVIDEDHKVTHWNRACEAIIGTKSSNVIGTKEQWKGFYSEPRPVLADLVLDNKLSEVTEYYSKSWAPSTLVENGWEATDHFPSFNAGEKWLYFTAAPLKNQEGKTIGAVETLQDVTNQKKYEEKLEFQANHDALTGLANRNLLTDRLDQAIAHATRDNRLLSLLFIDLDNFKTINDTLGHNVGDQLIRETAEKIQSVIRAGDTVARFGGDEFVVLLCSPDNEDHVTDVVQRISQQVAASYSHQGQALHVGSSIGVAVFPEDGNTAEALMMNADRAMYQAKDLNKGGFCFFTQDLNKRAFLRLQIESDLHKAIELEQFELVYQPILDLKTGKITAAEALIRWNHPEHGVINPTDFIHIAEETGLIVPIGEWVLKTASREALYWQETIGRPLRISINVSARQFRNNEIHTAVSNLINHIGKPSLNIELELTENLVMHNSEQAEQSLHELHDMGVHLVMDDFGTGYSSLAFLRRFPFDIIKIDKAFIDDLGKSREAEAIVRAMLYLGSALGLRMLAEGVETNIQHQFLAKEGCHEVQGFLYSRPVNDKAFRALLLDEWQWST
jgi:diguanylate cyclase (GGDEF)-like protein/PAS domain S-box-containing protein